MQENKTSYKKKLIVKKEINGDIIFELLKSHALALAVKTGNKKATKMLNTPGSRFITQIEVVPNPQRSSVKIDTIVEIFELLEEEKRGPEDRTSGNPVA